MLQVELDALFAGNAYGPVAAKLLANNFDTNALRTNSLLRYDEWKAFDDAILPIAKKKLRAVSALRSRGLVKVIPNGLGRTVLQSQKSSDRAPAKISMDAAERGSDDLIDYGLDYLPLPVTHAGFKLNIRQLNEGRNMAGAPSVDTDNAQAAMRVVAESNEYVLFNGYAGSFGGNQVYGLVNHPNVEGISLGTAWTDSSVDGADIRRKVVDEAIAALVANNHFGPYGVFVPNNYMVKLGDDYSSAKGDNTIKQRLLAVDEIEFVESSSQIPANTVVVVELDSNVVRVVEGLQPRMIEWATEGGLVSHFKVIDIIVPQVRADYDGKSGIAVIS